jgi:hypothetical protein
MTTYMLGWSAIDRWRRPYFSSLYIREKSLLENNGWEDKEMAGWGKLDRIEGPIFMRRYHRQFGQDILYLVTLTFTPLSPPEIEELLDQAVKFVQENSDLTEEYFREKREGEPPRYFVYKLVNDQKIDLCECKADEDANLILRALNRSSGRIADTIVFEKGSLFIVARGSQGEQIYRKLLPLLEAEQQKTLEAIKQVDK